MKNKIELPLKAKHFINTLYIDNCNCAIAKAAKDFFNTDDVNESVDLLIINNTDCYNHPSYGPRAFDSDQDKAVMLEDHETIINIISLTKVQ